MPELGGPSVLTARAGQTRHTGGVALAHPNMKRLARVACLASGLLCACGDGGSSDAAARAKPFEPVMVIGQAGTSPGTFLQPRSLATDGQWLFVADRSGRIQKFDAGTGKCVAWWTLPVFQNGMPTGLTIGPASSGVAAGGLVKAGEPVLYVADTHYHRVLVYPIGVEKFATSEGGRGESFTRGSLLMAPSAPKCDVPILAQFGAFGMGPGEFVYPTLVLPLLAPDGVTVERLYVSEYGDHDRVSVFDGDFKFLFSFGTPGSGREGSPVHFDRPQAMAFDPDGKALWITDARNHRVGRFTLEGALIDWLGGEGGQPGVTFNLPWTIAGLGDGSALIVDRGSSQVRRLMMDTGATIQTWGRPGRLPGELAEPWSVAATEKVVFVADTSNHRVQVFARPVKR